MSESATTFDCITVYTRRCAFVASVLLIGKLKRVLSIQLSGVAQLKVSPAMTEESLVIESKHCPTFQNAKLGPDVGELNNLEMGYFSSKESLSIFLAGRR